MSYYRDVYLKSDDWKVLRDSKIATTGTRCCLCCTICETVDVHHVKYKSLYDVKHHDLRILCRPCHDKVHALLDKYPKMKTLGRSILWQTVQCHLGTESNRAYFRSVIYKRQQKQMARILNSKKRELKARNSAERLAQPAQTL